MLDPSIIFGRLGNRLFQMSYIYNQVKKGDIPDIYIQGEEYFKESAEEIKQLYRVGVTPVNAVGIHVRRGDYVGNEFYVDLMKTDYYQLAMKEFPAENFLVFSDDIPWCRQQKIFAGCSFSEEADVLADFNLMAGCSGMIIANSSLSWWAGYLGEGKVIAPKAWFTDGVSRVTLPEHWIKI